MTIILKLELHSVHTSCSLKINYNSIILFYLYYYTTVIYSQHSERGKAGRRGCGMKSNLNLVMSTLESQSYQSCDEYAV